MPYFVYILKSESTGTSYIGHTSNLEKRLIEHNNGKSISTRKKRPGNSFTKRNIKLAQKLQRGKDISNQ